MHGGLFKIEGPPFRVGVPPGVVLEAKMEPEWTSKSMKILLKTYLEKRYENCPQNYPKMMPKFTQNGAKITPKIDPIF